MKIKNQKIEEARELLIKATKLLSQIIEIDTYSEEQNLEEWMMNRVELWCRIYNEGGLITKEKLHKIWRDEIGKDTRGIGGFFVGKKPSLQWTHDGKVMLTMKASEQVEAWTGRTLKEYSKKYRKVKK